MSVDTDHGKLSQKMQICHSAGYFGLSLLGIIWQIRGQSVLFNPQVQIILYTPNVNYSCRTAQLTSKVAFCIFIQQT